MMRKAQTRAEDLSALRAFLDRHRRLLVLTGAGCSAPSGIPDYRDADGSWKHTRPMTLADFTGSAAARRRYWAGSLRGWPRVRDARANPAHLALARLEHAGRVARLVTQNVDGLHQQAGSRRVVDLHGRLDQVECLRCSALVHRDDVQALLLAWNPRLFPGGTSPRSSGAQAAPGVDGEVRPDGDVGIGASPDDLLVPDCPECGGVLKPKVVFFGENVAPSVVEAAYELVHGARAARARHLAGRLLGLSLPAPRRRARHAGLHREPRPGARRGARAREDRREPRCRPRAPRPRIGLANRYAWSRRLAGFDERRTRLVGPTRASTAATTASSSSCLKGFRSTPST